MKKLLLLPAVLLVAALGVADNQYDRDQIRGRNDFQDQLWLGTQAAFAGTWTCANGSDLCTGTVATTTTTAALTAGDKIVLLASDSKYHSYEVASVVDDDNFRRLRWVSDTTEDPLLGVTASTMWEINTGLPASTPATLYDGAGTASPFKLSQNAFAFNGMLSGSVAGGLSTTQTVTFAQDGNNSTVTPLVVTNSNEPATGQTGDATRLSLNLMSTSNGGTSYSSVAGGVIEVWKLSDFFNASGVADNDSGITFYLSSNGTLAYQLWMVPSAVGVSANSDFFFGDYFNDYNRSLSDQLDRVPSDFVFDWTPSTGNIAAAVADLSLKRYQGLDGQERLEIDIATGAANGTGTGGIIVGAGTATWPSIIMGTASTPTGLFSPAAGIIDVNLNGTNTVGAGASVTESYDGALQDFVWSGVLDHNDLTDADDSQDFTIATLPAKAILKAAYMIVTTTWTDAGVADEALAFTVGSTSGGAEILESAAMAAAGTPTAANVVYGDADAERGTDLPDGEGMSAKLYNYAGTQVIYLRATDTGSGTLADYDTGEVRIVLMYAVLP